MYEALFFIAFGFGITNGSYGYYFQQRICSTISSDPKNCKANRKWNLQRAIASIHHPSAVKRNVTTLTLTGFSSRT